MFPNSIFHGHNRGGGHQRQHQSDARVAKVSGHVDQLHKIAQTLRLKRTFGTGVCFDRPSAKGVVDLAAKRVWISARFQQNFQLSHSAHQVGSTSPLKKVQMRVDVVFLARIGTAENAGDVHTNITNGKLVSNLDATPRRNRTSDDGGVLMRFKFRPATRNELEVASGLNPVRRNAVEYDDIQASAAVVGEDLNGNYVFHSVQPSDLAVVVLRQMTGGRAEFVRLEGDERSFC